MDHQTMDSCTTSIRDQEISTRNDTMLQLAGHETNSGSCTHLTLARTLNPETSGAGSSSMHAIRRHCCVRWKSKVNEPIPSSKNWCYSGCSPPVIEWKHNGPSVHTV